MEQIEYSQPTLVLTDITLRSDHLEAVISYALEQAKLSAGQINPLNWAANENDIGNHTADGKNTDDACEELLLALEGMLLAVRRARGIHHCDLVPMPLPSHFTSVLAYDANELK